MRYTLLRRLHRSYITVALSVGLIIGVAISFFFDLWLFESAIWVVVAGALLVLNFCLPRAICLALAVVAGFVLGSFRTSSDLGDRAYAAQFFEQTVTVTGTLYEDPETAGGATTFRINNLIFGDTAHQKPVAGSIFVKFYGHKPLERSHRVVLTGKLSPAFGSFIAAMYAPSIDQIAAPDPPDLALEFRNGFADIIKEFIPAPEVDLSLGYLLGQRRALPATLLETLKIVGLTHIIVASGYNLSVLVRLTRRIFKKVSRFAALFAGLLLIVGFIAITGFTPSMSRAGIVSILSLLAWYVGRKFHPAKLLLLVAAITLLLNPAYVQDLGWLLSFASFAGVMLLAPLLTAYFYDKDKKPNFVAQVVIETVAAQLICLPLLLYFFGTFSIVSLIANILILPTIPIVMALTFATGIATIVPVIATITGWAATRLLGYHIAVVEFFGDLPWALVSIPAENPLIFCAYPALLAIGIYLRQKTHLRLITVNIIE